MKILLTGATGFVGVHLVDKLLENGQEIFSLQRGVSPASPYVQVLYHDLRAEIPNWMLKQLEGVTHIVHLGAEVHGLRSLSNPELFVHTNILGTFNVLEASRRLCPARFIYVSSAEVLGSTATLCALGEDAALNPTNPYAAAKAGGEMLVQSYARSFGVPALIVRTTTLFGERQKPGKFVPDTARKILGGETVTVHSGSRQWLHVREFVHGLEFLLNAGQAGEIYHIAGVEKTNVEVVDLIGIALGTPIRLHFTPPGRGHDIQYCIKDTKLGNKGYQTSTVSDDLRNTALWYKGGQ